MSAPHTCPVCSHVFHWGADEDSAIVDRQGGNWKSCRENAHWKLTFHMREAHADQLMHCPRRGESAIGFSEEGDADYWHVRDHHRVCSYCGSMHPDEFFSAVEAGHKIGPTDKGYKAYVDLPHPDAEGERIVCSANFEHTGPGWIKVTKENEAELVRKYGSSAMIGDHAAENWIQIGKNGPTIHAKFYFQHLDPEQQKRFIELHNAKRMNLGYPGHFYARPYFATVAA